MLKLVILAIISVIAYAFAPSQYSYSFMLFCSAIFLMSSFFLLRNNCRESLLRFEFFFLIAYFFVNFVYGLVYYPINPYFSFFQYPFNETYITKGAALSTVGACFFNLAIFDRNVDCVPDKNFFVYLKKPTFLMCLLICLFIPNLIRLLFSGEYSTDFESSYLNAILVYIIYYFLFASFYNVSMIKNNKHQALLNEIGIPSLILIVIYVLLFLLIGSRTIPMRMILFVLLLYHVYLYKISKKIISLSLILGMIFFALIGVFRSGLMINSIWDIGQELTINNRSQYVLMEYCDIHGINFGKTMLINVLSILPFMQSLFCFLTGSTVVDISSAQLVTHLHYDNIAFYDKIIGFGTNLIGDIYISFGTLGVILLMILLGFLLRKFNSYIQCNFPVGSLFYFLLFMDCIYITRSGYCTSLRTLTWTFSIYYLCNYITFTFIKK